PTRTARRWWAWRRSCNPKSRLTSSASRALAASLSRSMPQVSAQSNVASRNCPGSSIRNRLSIFFAAVMPARRSRQCTRTRRLRSELIDRASAKHASCLDRALHYDHRVAADRSGDQLSAREHEREPDQARASHLVALLDRNRMLAIGEIAACGQKAGKCGRSRAGRGVFADTEPDPEHTRMEVVPGLDRLSTKYIDAAIAHGAVELVAIGTAAADRCKARDRHEDKRISRRPA